MTAGILSRLIVLTGRSRWAKHMTDALQAKLKVMSSLWCQDYART
jgi:hypothetical protein